MTTTGRGLGGSVEGMAHMETSTVSRERRTSPARRWLRAMAALYRRWWWLVLVDGFIGPALGGAVFLGMGSTPLDRGFWRDAEWMLTSAGAPDTRLVGVSLALATVVLAPLLIRWIQAGVDAHASRWRVVGRGVLGGIAFPFLSAPLTTTILFVTVTVPELDGSLTVPELILGAPALAMVTALTLSVLLAVPMALAGALFGLVNAAGVLVGNAASGRSPSGNAASGNA